MSDWTLPLLPTNGLDRSLHAPVLVGLLFVSLFTEAFGWTYAGLVVPGYLAVTFAAAPITAVLVLFEGWASHVGVALIARIIPARTGAWSTAFGRERFFLYIVVAIIVRLYVEGTAVPWLTVHYGLTHSRELYSIGLVLVPLVANVFWSSGVGHAGPRLLTMTGLTYLVVDQVLLKHTNFSLSRFQVANESVALHFLDTPKAYLLLLVGAMLGARGNVRYGWDYNGILVPALLAVAWYEPLRLLGTALEAIAIYLLARFLASIRPFSRLAIVGPRRMVFVGILGFLVKLVIGHALVRVAPEVQLTEYLGFGYILPSLLAVKMWNKLRIGIVLMPTLQVSLSAFLVGNALGFALNWIWGWGAPPPSTAREIRATESVSYTWLLASYRQPARAGECNAALDIGTVEEVLENWLRRGYPDARDLATLDALDLEIYADRGLWSVIVPKSTAASTCAELRIAIAPELKKRGGTVGLYLAPTPYGSPLPVAALAVAEATQAPLVVSYVPAHGGRETHAFELSALMLTPIALSVAASDDNRLTIAGALPGNLDVAAIERALSARIDLTFVDPNRTPRPQLNLGLAGAERIASAYLGRQGIEQWPRELRREFETRIGDLIGRGYRAPSHAEIVLLSSCVLPALEAEAVPSDWVLAVAARLGYRVARSRISAQPLWVLYEPPGTDRRGNATWVVRAGTGRPLTVEVPAPLWELGTLSYGLTLFDVLGARHLLVSGTRPDAKPDGSADPRRAAGKDSFFQRLHEVTLAEGDEVLAIHAIRPDVPIAEDVVVECTAPILTDAQRPRMTTDALSTLTRAGLNGTYYSAAENQASIGAQFDPAFAFAERFAPDRMCRLWFSQRAREHISRVPSSLEAFRRLMDRSPLDVDVAELALRRSSTRRRPHDGATIACDLDHVTAAVRDWLERNNPYDRLDAKRLGASCEWHAAVDARTGVPWLVLIGDGSTRLIPLHSKKAFERATTTEPDPGSLRELVALGLSSITLEAP